ncbi:MULTISPECIES: MarR family transcriptional regulator [unclassified Streptomyces]|uniref:MarR family winged helix-turn-helix transcriptional regulator n=1 Tax=unclassified Streptomyces TaxID=2593676 RepID=UPI00037B27B3|nr:MULTISPECIES: MarR family transcriptional regulator [unclassified Streptomyces]MYT34034.1 MarR family transcriptional regulator [Streptomyces sp. SID8354]
MADETTSSAPGSPTAPRPTEARAAVPPALTAAPGYQVRRLYQAYLAVWVRAVDPTLTGPQFAVLTAVDATPGRDQRSMASAVALDTSTMADVARRLESRGLIVRRADAADGRRKLLFLTEDGERTLRAARERTRRLDERLMAPYDAAQRADVMRLLTSLADRWEGLAEDC